MAKTIKLDNLLQAIHQAVLEAQTLIEQQHLEQLDRHFEWPDDEDRKNEDMASHILRTGGAAKTWVVEVPNLHPEAEKGSTTTIQVPLMSLIPPTTIKIKNMVVEFKVALGQLVEEKKKSRRVRTNPWNRYGQNVIDWKTVKRDSLPHLISFVLIKATQGSKATDPFFTTNWAFAETEGILKGAYHFYQYKDPQLEQAAHYISQVNLFSKDILPIVDVELDCAGCSRPEISDKLLVQNLKTYLQAIENHYKVKPMIYIYEAFYQTYLKGHFDDYPYWLARFSSRPPTEFKMVPDSITQPEITMWQITDFGKIKGISGKTDMSFLPASFKEKILIRE
ncbi:GH25 family lysozyme [Cyclobacterium jeungdonense]|uniref:GH25 family lysozyme n=1 Tax=Cyclobacterium jeungdonense TaxID=708087 RepID=A0ABT8C1E2_9BACT|nr:GH25 family lysozyme [Cyclobacterium jeungdonense]MDN3686604.1 GH25 family lysozyme [Cyclobacterium jeungdonense]